MTRIFDMAAYKYGLLILFFYGSLFFNPVWGEEEKDTNSSAKIQGVVRVVQPGVFDYQSSDYLIRMRAWGVGFPKRSQPGYNEALSFTERELLSKAVEFKIKQEFDLQNITAVEIFTGIEKENFSLLAIRDGIGWHLEGETERNGMFTMAQLKAKRKRIGVWRYGDVFQTENNNPTLPHPLLRNVIGQNPFSAGLNYWVTSFGKIHRPGCSFYERGRGELSRRPTGTDCRICGGTNPRD
jgi:hypothetical protein